MLSKTVTLSNLINDCVVLAKDAGRIVKNTVQYAATKQHPNAETVKNQSGISNADYLIRQTYLHNLS